MVVFMALSSTDLIVEEEQEEIKKISVIVVEQEGCNTDNFKRGIEQAANAVRADVSYIEIQSEEEDEKILEYMKRESERGEQAMIFFSEREDLVLRYLQSEWEKIPLICVNSYSDYEGPALRVGLDVENMAKSFAERIEKIYGTDITAVLITNGKEDSENISRFLEDAFREKNIKTKKIEDSRKQVRKYAEEYSEDKIFVGCCTAATERTAVYLKEGEAALYGVGYSNEILQYIREGSIEGVMAYSMYSIGINAMECAGEILGKKQMEKKDVLVSSRWITKDNMKSEYEFLFPIY